MNNPILSLPPWAVVGTILGAIAFTILERRRRSSAPQLPPGPPGLPLVGNLFNMPTERQYATWAEWKELYGDVVYTSVFGQSVVILNSLQAAKDLLEKRSLLYSDRPYSPMGDLSGWTSAFILQPYGITLRNYRRLAHKLMGTNTIVKPFYPMQDDETRKFLKSLLRSPDQVFTHIHNNVASIILRITYGYQIVEGDPLVKKIEDAMDQFGSAVSSKWLVNIFPLLRHVPSWLPGAGFKNQAKIWADELNDVVNYPMEWVKRQMSRGTAEPSYASLHLGNGEDEHTIAWSAQSLYGAGFETTAISVTVFLKVMTMFPEIQARAQEEVDSVIPDDRLPEPEDVEKLTYLRAVLSEMLRWHSTVPTGNPHRVMDDDIYNGYLIPKGTIIAYNAWLFAHDPATYKNPDEFNPARFIGSSPELDPREYIFGFGRRICAGRYLAEATIMLFMARTLKYFQINKFVDENGVVHTPTNEEGADGLISHPSPFKCDIKPRSEKAAAFVRDL